MITNHSFNLGNHNIWLEKYYDHQTLQVCCQH